MGKQFTCTSESQLIEVAGKIANKTITILIDSGTSNSYISPDLVKKCHLKKIKPETCHFPNF